MAGCSRSLSRQRVDCRGDRLKRQFPLCASGRRSRQTAGCRQTARLLARHQADGEGSRQGASAAARAPPRIACIASWSFDAHPLACAVLAAPQPWSWPGLRRMGYPHPRRRMSRPLRLKTVPAVCDEPTRPFTLAPCPSRRSSLEVGRSHSERQVDKVSYCICPTVAVGFLARPRKPSPNKVRQCVWRRRKGD